MWLDVTSTNFSMGAVKYVSFILSFISIIILFVLYCYLCYYISDHEFLGEEATGNLAYFLVDIKVEAKSYIFYHVINIMKKIFIIFIAIFLYGSFEVIFLFFFLWSL